MDGIRSYLLGIVAAAFLCTIASYLAGKNSFSGSAIKLITGAIMLLTLASPVMKLRIDNPYEIFDDVSEQAERITSYAADSAQESLSGIIKEKTQAYILDKANYYGVEVSVEVSLSDGDIPQPASVCISGNISPYNKKLLSDTIEKDLGIPTEAQIWK